MNLLSWLILLGIAALIVRALGISLIDRIVKYQQTHANNLVRPVLLARLFTLRDGLSALSYIEYLSRYNEYNNIINANGWAHFVHDFPKIIEPIYSGTAFTFRAMTEDEFNVDKAKGLIVGKMAGTKEEQDNLHRFAK